MAATDPFVLFDSWLDDASASELNDPNAMVLATSTPHGHPSLRAVLLKGHGPEGFTFYTNAQSRKADEIAANSNVALLFYWKSLRRQVRIEGVAHEVDPSQADAYFATRSRQSQIGAWASDQSRPLENRSLFEARYAEAERKFEGVAVPRPPYWSGYRVVPERIEFWSDRPHRLHERRLFTLSGDGWTEGLLYP